MRRHFRRHVPLLMSHFGLKPWELDDLTYGEIDACLEALGLDGEGGVDGHSQP